MAFKMKNEKGKFDFGNKTTFNIGKKFENEKPKLTSNYSLSGEGGSQSGITVPKSLITGASGNFSYGTKKRNINLSGGAHLPTGTGNINISGKTNIGKKGASVNASISASSGQKPTYNLGLVLPFGGKKNKKIKGKNI